MQSDSCSLVKITLFLPGLVKTFKYSLYLIFINPYPIISNDNLIISGSVVFSFRLFTRMQTDRYSSPGRSILQCIGQYIDQYLIKMLRINLGVEFFIISLKGKINLFGFRLIFEHPVYFPGKLHYFSLPKPEGHLPFIYLTHIHQLVNEMKDPLTVPLYNGICFAALRIFISCH